MRMLKPFLLATTEFIVGVDSFDALEINSTSTNGFYYFKNTQKNSLVKTFVLKKGPLSQKHCEVTLIKREGQDSFKPRFDFEILDLTKKVVASVELPVTEGENRLVKAKVDLGDCHEEFSLLIGFIQGIKDVELNAASFAVVTKDQKDQLTQLLTNVGKDVAVAELTKQYAGKLTEKDLSIMAGRKENLEAFGRLLTDEEFFASQLQKLGANKRPEDLWQAFFEKYRWVFGYGLQLVCCEGLDEKKLETVVVGNDIIDGSGKRTDALLKTRGRISKTLFCEIKTHRTPLMKDYPRPGVFVPSADLQGAIGQIQKTIHKVALKLTNNFNKIFFPNGTPSGEELAFIRPKGLIVVGQLDQFNTPTGLNEEQFSSFELYRQQLEGIEILTFDELYERTRYIVEQ